MADAKIIDGKAIAEMLSNRIASEVATMKAAHNLQPGIAVVLIGDDPASRIYVRRKTKQAAVAGIRAIDHVFAEDVQQDEILTLIENLNANESIHGILVQLPLPRHIEARTVLRAISPAKDVDGFHPYNRGLLAEGLVQEALVPCTPFGCLMMLRQVLGDLSGREAVIVGRSNIVGKPMAQLLLDGNSTVTVCHSRTADIQDHCRRADIMVAAVGLPELIRGNWLKPGCTVIDVGINRLQDGSGKARIVGDVAFAEAVKVAGAITPVPGGVGPMTIACLLANTVTASCQQKGIRAPNWLG